MARRGRSDFRLQRFDRNRGIFALDAVENLSKQFLGVGSDHSAGTAWMATLFGPCFDFEAVGGQLLGNFFECHDLPRRNPITRGMSMRCASIFRAARFEVLLEEHALVRHVLIDEPEAIGRFTATMSSRSLAPEV